MKKKILSYVIGILIPLAVGGFSALLTKDNMDIYDTVVKPALAPPGILFPIAWSILYVLMGIGSALVFNAEVDARSKRKALILYGAQLFVNFFWSILFFNKRLFLASFLWLVLLWGLIVAMIASFYKIHKGTGLIQLPYLIWVTFAGYLNLAIYLLN